MQGKLPTIPNITQVTNLSNSVLFEFFPWVRPQS